MEGIAADAVGNVYLTGNLNGWVVQRRTPDGVWEEPQNVDIPQGSGTEEMSWGHAIAVDRAGNVYTGGEVRPGSSGVVNRRWVVKRLRPEPVPPLDIAKAGQTTVVKWPGWYASDALLETVERLDSTATWRPVATPPTTVGEEKTVPVDSKGGMKFYRLRKP